MARMTLEQLTTQLRGAWEETLHALVLYGSSAASDASTAPAGQDVLVIVDTLDVAHLEAAAAVVRAWTDAGNPPPMTMTAEEWRGSADIFPMEYADILARHRVLFGELPTEGVQVAPADLRWQLENQTMGKLLHLRRGVLAAGGDARRQTELLEVSKSAVLVLFRATLRLHGLAPASDSAEVVRETARVAGLDAEPFLRVLRHVRKEATLARSDAASTLTGYVAGIAQLKRHLDQYSSEHPSLTTRTENQR